MQSRDRSRLKFFDRTHNRDQKILIAPVIAFHFFHRDRFMGENGMNLVQNTRTFSTKNFGKCNILASGNEYFNQLAK